MIKHLKVTSSCKVCQKIIIESVIVKTESDLKIKNLTNAVLNNSDSPKCKKCNIPFVKVSYTFCHEEKIQFSTTQTQITTSK